jgi:HD-like signal output (HDOD) protein
MSLFAWVTRKLKKSAAVVLPATMDNNGAPESGEAEIAKLFTAESKRNVRSGQSLDADLGRSTSYFYVESGSANLEPLRSVLSAGDCMGQACLPEGRGCRLRAVEDCTIVEITPEALNRVPLAAQVLLLSAVNRTTVRLMQECLSLGMGAIQNSPNLTAYPIQQLMKPAEVVETGVIAEFLSEIPRLPVHATSLAENLLRDDVSVRDVIEPIKGDAALAAMVLRVVNSSKYGFSRKIETFYRACVILGFDSIYELLMREVVDTTIPTSPESYDIYVHSCLVSAFADQIAAVGASKDRRGTTGALLQGLLHDVGRSVLAAVKDRHKEFGPVLDGVDHTVVGAELLKRWNLPERIWRVIELQRYPDFAPPEALPAELRNDVAILYLAHHCADLVRDNDPPDTIFQSEYISLLELPVRDINGLYEMIVPLLYKKAGLPAEVRKLIGCPDLQPA